MVNRIEAIRRLKLHEAELRDLGVARLSLFGSVARGEERALSDVDIAVTFASDARAGLLQWARVAGRLEEAIGGKIDMISEPARQPRFQAEIDRDRVVVF